MLASGCGDVRFRKRACRLDVVSGIQRHEELEGQEGKRDDDAGREIQEERDLGGGIPGGFDVYVPSQVVSRSWSGSRALRSFCLVCSRKDSAMAILKGFGVAIRYLFLWWTSSVAGYPGATKVSLIHT